MKALTLIRPMAAAVVRGSKRIENRPRDLPKAMRGVETIVAVHAGKKWDDVYLQTIERIDGEGRYDCVALAYRKHLDDEGIVGLMRLSGFSYTEDDKPEIGYGGHLDPWWGGPFGYEIEDVIAFDKPIPCAGQLGFWEVPFNVELRIYRSIPHELRTGWRTT